MKLRMTWPTLVVAALLLASAPSASAQCADPTTHFRGGLWKQWILQIVPGPDAAAAVQRILAAINQPRAAAALPLLVFDPEEVLAVGIIEENNPRGPDGANLVDRFRIRRYSSRPSPGSATARSWCSSRIHFGQGPS